MKCAWLLFLSMLLTGFLFAQPKPESFAMNAAYPVLPTHPSGGIVPGARFMVARFPLGLLAREYYPDPTPVDPATIRIEVVSAGRTFPARVLAVTDTRVEALLPADVPLGKADVRVFVQNQKKFDSPVRVVAIAPGLYTHTHFGTQLVAYRQNGDSIGLVQPARPGEVVRLRGSGFGLPPQQLVEVRVGGIIARVAVVRSTPDGDHLVEVEVPANSKEGCFVPVVARTGGKWSNFGSLPVVNGAGPCRLHGVAEGTLEQSAASGLIRLGTIELERSPFWVGGRFPSRKDRIIGGFEQQPVSALTGFPPPGTCTVSSSRWGIHHDPERILSGPVKMSGGKFEWTVTSEKGYVSGLREDAPWYFRPMMQIEKDGFVQNGSYLLEVAAGRDVEPFSMPYTIQQRSPKWANWILGAFPRTKDLKLHWFGGRPGDLAVINLGLMAHGHGIYVRCAERAEAKSLSIPVWILEQFPDPERTSALLSLKVLAPPQTTRPKGLDSFSFTFSEESLQRLTWK